MKLWLKYALALALVAIIPVSIAAWQIAGAGVEHIEAEAQRFHLASAGLMDAAVTATTSRGAVEAVQVGSALAKTETPIETRISIATALIKGADQLDTFAVYTADGALMDTLVAAGEGEQVDAVKAPESLSAEQRARAEDGGVAYGDVFKSAGGVIRLPVIVRIVTAQDKVFGYGWAPLDISGLSDEARTLSNKQTGDPNNIVVYDGRLKVVAAADTTTLMQDSGGKGALVDVTNGAVFSKGLAHTVKYVAADGTPMLGAISANPDMGWAITVGEPSAEVYKQVDAIWTTAFVLGGGFALLALLIGIFFGKRLSAPIVALSQAAGKVAAGDFTVQVAASGKDEVGQLATSFNSMTNQLTATIEELKTATAVRERMQTELDIGHNIQMSMVPQEFPAFPERGEFDIHAALHPAYEVGGDFYDFFLTDEDTLCVVVADVSGKGVGAALFMAVTRTMVQAHASTGTGPEDIIERVNDELARDNDECMFVTFFVCLFDLKTGRLRFTNAGHNPSYIKRLDGSIERLEELHGPVVAAMEEVPYGSAETMLAKGDALVMYTDGVNEAMNAAKDLYTEERLADLLRDTQWEASKEVVKVMLDDVWSFQGDAEQSDDVTIVALTYNGLAG